MLARIPTPRASSPAKPVTEAESMSLPRPYKLRNYYTAKEVAAHNGARDCWVSLFN